MCIVRGKGLCKETEEGQTGGSQKKGGPGRPGQRVFQGLRCF